METDIHTQVRSQPLQLELLESLAVFVDRFSHSMRTSLSVSMNIIEDQMAGHSLSPQDLVDAHCGLKSILYTLNAVKELGQPIRYQPEQVLLSTLIEDEAPRLLGAREQLIINRYQSKNESVRALDRKLVERLLRTVLRYSRSRVLRFADGDERQTTLIVADSNDNTHAQDITVTVPQAQTVDYDLLSGSHHLRNVALIDQVPDSLGLIFADAVMNFIGGHAMLEWYEPRELVLRLTFRAALNR